ncbi:DUF4365 domain-containing protein [Flavobacterium pectinovorum]|uniref:DUF4365 domain-containing protein n=1 Tax=Flavobacterium pectinovorum TaxID=29533 RepID=UPI00265F1CED|nr:DUF4365 domain-containing protein [Flavobacterium pectinovorum]WKL50439.1 DUF4365 domain-containing protein [Flavobacterium pectinovorum]
MKLPKRSKQHISESNSYKLFQSKIPNNWIIRETTERDYGIDCYLELVNENNDLTGELVLIQLKSRQSIEWTTSDTYKISDIKISTTNYWNKFAVPVFIFLADIQAQEIYFLSVKFWIRRKFLEYSKQKKFPIEFEKDFIFNLTGGLDNFKLYFYYEHNRKQFENELIFFLSNLKYYKDFLSEHKSRDFQFGIESPDLIYFEAMHRNFEFLCNYLYIPFTIPSLSKIKAESEKKFGAELYYELYEQDIAELVENFQHLTSTITTCLKIFFDVEAEYWITKNLTVFNYLNNIGEDGSLPY